MHFEECKGKHYKKKEKNVKSYEFALNRRPGRAQDAAGSSVSRKPESCQMRNMFVMLQKTRQSDITNEFHVHA
jgi:hypothetical protein